MAEPTVEWFGVKVLVSDLVAMSKPGGALDDASKTAATGVLAPPAATTRSSVPHVSGAMADSIAVKPRRWGAWLTEGSRQVPYAGWVDFGGRRPQSGPRPYLPQGRYLYPSAGNLEQPAVTAFSREFQTALDRYGWTNLTTDPGAVHD